MEALGHQRIERAPSVGIVPRLAARLAAWRLDRALALGGDPRSSPVLAARAAQLTRRRNREALASRLDAALAASGQPRAMPSAAIQPPLVEVASARELLAQAAAILRSEEPIHCAGAARLRLLLSDGASPLYY